MSGAMSGETKSLSRQTQLTLFLLALLPLWYTLGKGLQAPSKSLADTPYYMECCVCGLEHPCGPEGVTGMRCPRCAPAEATMLFRTRANNATWDLLVKLLVGIIAFMAVLVLLLGNGNRKKSPEPSEPAPAATVAETREEEINSWARGVVEKRRKRLEP